MKGANPQIGTVPCPVTACVIVAEVRRFALRSQTDAGRRKAGKLYCDCSVHGRFGFDGAPAMQDYILEKGEIWGSENQPRKPASEQAPPLESQPASDHQGESQTPTPAAPAAVKPAPAAAPARKKFDLYDWR